MINYAIICLVPQIELTQSGDIKTGSCIFLFTVNSC